jgi:hypothetical protein
MTAAWLGYALTTVERWPHLIAAYQVNSAGIDASTLVTPTFTPVTGEYIIVKAVGADSSLTFGTPTGGGWSYGNFFNDGAASHTRVAVWLATGITGGTPQTVSLTAAGTSQNHSMVVERWTAIRSGPVAPTTDVTGSGAPTSTVSQLSDFGMVSWVCGDWAAVDGTLTRTYRSDAQETGFRWLTGQFAAYWGYQLTSTPGAQTIGLSAPAGQTYTLCGVGFQSNGQPGHPAPRMWQAVARASFQ